MTEEQDLILKELEVMKKENKELKKTLGELLEEAKRQGWILGTPVKQLPK